MEALMALSISPLSFPWLIAVVALVCAYGAGRRRNQNNRRDF
jgi:hypothetical protein